MHLPESLTGSSRCNLSLYPLSVSHQLRILQTTDAECQHVANYSLLPKLAGCAHIVVVWLLQMKGMLKCSIVHALVSA